MKFLQTMVEANSNYLYGRQKP